MSSYYSDEDEIDVRIHRGRASPGYAEHRPRTVARPVYYTHGSSYLVPEHSGGSVHRSRSTGRRSPEHAPAPAPAPVIINNRIYNDYEDEEDDGHGRYLQLARPARPRSRSRSRAGSFVSSRSSREESHKDYELEKTRKELEHFRIEAEREKEEKRLKKELELQKLREEKRAKEEKERLKRETEEAIEKFKIESMEKAAKEKKEKEEAYEKFKREQAEKEAKEKKEKEEREKEYQRRLEEDLRNSGMDERQIAAVLKKEKAVDPNRPTYTRMSRRHLSIETLNRYRIDYEFDVDPEYVLVKRWVPEYEQDFLWNHTREIRERRQPVLVAIEGKKKHHGEPEFEFVRKKHHERRPSPSPLLTFLAGGKR